VPDPRPAAAVERLEHMLAAADAVAGYVARGRAAFDTDPALGDAVLYQLVVLGEAAKAALQADPALRIRYPDVPWSPMARVRDRAAHHYYKLDRDLVWDTARTAVPAAGIAIRAALRELGRPSP
jgi:uncharacterized protein with HEPN domain